MMIAKVATGMTLAFVLTSCERGSSPEPAPPSQVSSQMSSQVSSPSAGTAAPAAATTAQLLVLPTPSAWSAETQAAVNVAKDSNLFATGGVGFSGDAPDDLVSAQKVEQQPEAVPALVWLYSYGSPEARVYAYWGLRKLAPDLALTIADQVHADNAPVRAMYGCSHGQETVASAAARVELFGKRPPQP